MVYLIHLSSKLAHSQHYIGFVEGEQNLEQRLEYHRSGRGSKFLKAVAEAKIDFDISRIWPDGDRNFERQLKNRKNARLLCPVCNKNLKTTNYEIYTQTKGDSI